MFVDRIIGAMILSILVLGCLWACDNTDSSTAQPLDKSLPVAYQGALAGISP